jgi:predicted molibdopterin-dependent oxidoreductase YjgC
VRYFIRDDGKFKVRFYFPPPVKTMENDIFEPFERLLEIEIVGEKREVPEHNSLLRCFQYLSMETISHSDLCWNGDCAKCQIWLEDSENQKPLLACRTPVREGMKIVRLSDDINLTQKGELKLKDS